MADEGDQGQQTIAELVQDVAAGIARIDRGIGRQADEADRQDDRRQNRAQRIDRFGGGPLPGRSQGEIAHRALGSLTPTGRDPALLPTNDMTHSLARQRRPKTRLRHMDRLSRNRVNAASPRSAWGEGKAGRETITAR